MVSVSGGGVDGSCIVGKGTRGRGCTTVCGLLLVSVGTEESVPDVALSWEVFGS